MDGDSLQMIGAVAAAIVAGVGGTLGVQRVRNGGNKYVREDLCDERSGGLRRQLDRIEAKLDRVIEGE